MFFLNRLKRLLKKLRIEIKKRTLNYMILTWKKGKRYLWNREQEVKEGDRGTKKVMIY